MEQIFRKLEDENVCSYDDLMDATANYSYNYSFIDQSMQATPSARGLPVPGYV